MSANLFAALALASGATMLSPSRVSAGETCSAVFVETIQPILNRYCVVCHQDAAPAQGLSLQRTSAPASLLGVKSTQAPKLALVQPGDPEMSYLFLKLTNTHLGVGGNGAQMPLAGLIPNDTIASIRAWITGCAATAAGG